MRWISWVSLVSELPILMARLSMRIFWTQILHSTVSIQIQATYLSTLEVSHCHRLCMSSSKTCLVLYLKVKPLAAEGSAQFAYFPEPATMQLTLRFGRWVSKSSGVDKLSTCAFLCHPLQRLRVVNATSSSRESIQRRPNPYWSGLCSSSSSPYSSQRARLAAQSHRH